MDCDSFMTVLVPFMIPCGSGNLRLDKDNLIKDTSLPISEIQTIKESLSELELLHELGHCSFFHLISKNKKLSQRTMDSYSE